MIKSQLKVMLAKREMLQRELAEAAGVRLPTVNDLCNSKSRHIPVEALDRICDVLDCQPGDLFIHIKDKS